MQWLQDKKNLPFVIGGVAAVIVIAVVAVLLMMKGRAGSEQSASSGGATAPMAIQPPGSIPSPGGTAYGPGTAGAPGTGITVGITSNPTTAPTVSGTSAATPGAQTGATAVAGQRGAAGTLLAANPAPMLPGKVDPFDPGYSTRTRNVPPPPPPLPVDYPRGLLFQQKAKPPKEFVNLIPPPPMRLAAVLYSNRVSALLQTPDGYEIIKPGQKLPDGSLVQSIERDRVILLTADREPRRIEVRLAASTTSSAAGPGVMPGGPGRSLNVPAPGTPGSMGPGTRLRENLPTDERRAM